MFLLLLLRGKTLLIAISFYAIQIVMASAAANGATLKATHIIQLTANNDNHTEKMSINVVKHITTDGHQIDGDNNNNNDDDILPTDDGYDGRIIGGQKTSIANYPYQVSVQHQGAHICGGSIIMPNVILTAAHCIENPQDVDAFHVRAGSTTHLRGGQLRRVHQIIKHESYTLTNLDCDVALMVLSNNLTYNRKVKSVQLAVANAVVPGQEPLYVSGWGLTSETGSVSAYLNHVAVRLINRHNCAKNYQFVATITRQMFCAGYPQGGRDSCQGDSGGPLVVNYVGAQQAAKATNDTLSPSLPLTSFASLPLWSPPKSPFPAAASATESLATPSRRVARGPIQYGIVSWGVGCAQEGYPGVYTDVGALRPWIDGKLREINHMYNK